MHSSTTFKMLVGYFLVLFMSHAQVEVVEGIEILDALLSPIIDFKENLINGVFGKGKCGCPCRSYWVPKCEIAHVQQCHYDHYQNQVCHTVPVPQVRQAKETECQRCRKYTVPTPATKWAIECNPVYDEKCKTSYPQHCKVETRCHMLYQTVCEDSSYGYGGQTCGSVPREHCYPETKCHRTPMTQCKPVQKEKCVKVPREVIVQKVQKQCLPFEVNQAELDAQANIDPCAQQGYGVGAPVNLPQGAPAPNDYSVGAPAPNGYSVGAPAPNDYSVGAPAPNDYSVGAPAPNDYNVGVPATNDYSVGVQAVNGYSIGNNGQRKRQALGGKPTIPVENLYTVDAYVPGGVLVNEPLPHNQYYAGRIGERREVPLTGSNPFAHQHSIAQDPLLGQSEDGRVANFNQKRQLNPANKENNPFLRKPKPLRHFKLVRPEELNSLGKLKQDVETNIISDSLSSGKKKNLTKNEKEIEESRFTSDSYEGWRPISHPVEGK